mmetsp:Transcript_39024/g.79888  ORF Transcript_39024/g.79888 Transcript_39024/m.79888 type:complete len:91 (+) Transcript_39024:258-530(+)
MYLPVPGRPVSKYLTTLPVSNLDMLKCRRRCEAILRSKPDSRAAAELHLACIDAAEEAEQRRAKKAAAGTAAVAALGVAVAIGGMLVSKR